MAVCRKATIQSQTVPNVINHVWDPLALNEVGQPIEFPHYTDKTMMNYATQYGPSGSITLRGSNDPRVLADVAAWEASGRTTYTETAIWIPLVDPQGNAITKTADSIEAILENPRFISPKCTVGDATSAITMTLCSKKVN